MLCFFISSYAKLSLYIVGRYGLIYKDNSEHILKNIVEDIAKLLCPPPLLSYASNLLVGNNLKYFHASLNLSLHRALGECGLEERVVDRL